MKRIIALMLLMLVPALGQERELGTNPFQGSFSDGGFDFTVLDEDIGNSAFELVTQDTGFTQMSADTTLSIISFNASTDDTALVTVTGVRPWGGAQYADSLRYWIETIKVAGTDTVVTDSIYHLYEGAFIDSAMSGAVMVYATGTSPRDAVLDTVAANRFFQPNAHVLFGRHDKPVIDRIHYTVFSTTGTQGVRFELRVYPNLRAALDYTTEYYVADYVYVRPENGEVVAHYGSQWTGMGIPAGSGVAVVAQGDVDNMVAKVRIVGRRRGR